MKLFIIVFSILIFLFTIILFVIKDKKDGFNTLNDFNRKKLSFIKINYTSKIVKDMEFLLKQNGKIKIFGLNFKSPESFLLFRILMAISFTLIFNIFGFAVDKNFLVISIAAGLMIYFLPLEIFRGKLTLNGRKILKELPDIIDIISSLIKAGLTLDETISYISNNYDNEISKLFRIFKIKIMEGLIQSEAYEVIAKLSFCDEFGRIIKLFSQSEAIGNPIKDVLKDLSKTIRNNQRDLMKIKAEKLEGNLIIIIFVFIFIPMLAIFLIPVIPQLKILF
jgi:Flp pilus assembly protein TadB